jgi:hypothetical protein
LPRFACDAIVALKKAVLVLSSFVAKRLRTARSDCILIKVRGAIALRTAPFLISASPLQPIMNSLYSNCPLRMLQPPLGERGSLTSESVFPSARSAWGRHERGLAQRGLTQLKERFPCSALTKIPCLRSAMKTLLISAEVREKLLRIAEEEGFWAQRKLPTSMAA